MVGGDCNWLRFPAFRGKSKPVEGIPLPEESRKMRLCRGGWSLFQARRSLILQEGV